MMSRIVTSSARLCAAALTLILAACGGPTTGLFPAGSTMDKLHKTGQITVGVKSDQPGLGFLNPATGKFEGFDIEIAEIIAAKLGLKPNQIHYVETVSDNRERFLTNGTVDIVVASYSITPERRRQVGQAGPYYVTGAALLVRQPDEDTINHPNKLADVKVCSVTGSTSITLAQKKYRARPIGLKTYTECVQRLLNGTVDAVTTDDVVLIGYANRQPGLTVVGGRFSDERYGIGYRKGDQQFCQFLTDTIKEALDNGAWLKAFRETLGSAGAKPSQKPTPEPCHP
jgi:glutamate transport system substrate-binding protein